MKYHYAGKNGRGLRKRRSTPPCAARYRGGSKKKILKKKSYVAGEWINAYPFKASRKLGPKTVYLALTDQNGKEQGKGTECAQPEKARLD